MNEEKDIGKLAFQAYWGDAALDDEWEQTVPSFKRNWGRTAQAVIQHFIKTSLGGQEELPEWGLLSPHQVTMKGDFKLRGDGVWQELEMGGWPSNGSVVKRRIRHAAGAFHLGSPEGVRPPVSGMEGSGADVPRGVVSQDDHHLVPGVPVCRKCNVPMGFGKAIPEAVVSMGEGQYSVGAHQGNAPMVDVWKCPQCGHSFRAETPDWNPKEYDLLMQVHSLTAERDQLLKEVEELKQDLYETTESYEKSAYDRDAFARDCLALQERLSRFSWKPVSTPPTEADADEKGAVIFKKKTGGLISLSWDSTLETQQFWGVTHWHGLSKLQSAPESEGEEAFLAWWHSQEPDKTPSMKAVSMAAARHIWQAALKSTNN